MAFAFEDFLEEYQKKEVILFSNALKEKPLVSVCVQAYQHVSYIQKCLEGILKQKTNFKYEILLGEDHSSDGTREICVKYAQKYPDRIRLFLHHRENNIEVGGNPTGRFNFMYNFYSANGKYIAFCEGDDYWDDPMKLQKQVDFLESNPDYIIAYHDAKIIDSDENLIKESKLSDKWRRDFSCTELKQAPFILTLTVCFRNIVSDFPKEFYNVLNADSFLFSLLGQFGKGKYMETIEPACYREHSGGIWSTISVFNKGRNSLNTYRNLRRYYSKVGDQETARYFQNQERDIYISIIDNTAIVKNFGILSSFFYNEGGIQSWIWFVLYKLASKFFANSNFIKEQLLLSVERLK